LARLGQEEKSRGRQSEVVTWKGFEQKEQKREKKVAGFENKKAIALFCFFGGGHRIATI
jgi:oligoribonuclease NrnB/cAMP/cGMP phosphodiesterase (DHH superfamily)